MTALRPRPCRRELVQAILIAVLCALAFLRAGVLPTRAVVPFPPERFEPLRSELLAAGEITQEEIDRGNASMGDKYNQSLAWDRILQDRLQSGELPLWSRDIAGGVAFVPQMAQVYQPWNLLLALPLASSVGMYGPWYFLHLVLWGTFAYWFFRRIGLHHHAGLLGLVVAVLGLWTQARVHHNVILSAALPLWPMLTIVHAGFRGGGIGPGRIALLGLCAGISWSGGFAPVSLQVTLLCGAWALFLAIRERDHRPLWGIAAGLGLGALLALPQMGPTLLASTDSARQPIAPAGLTAAGMSWQHLRTLVWPDLLAWPEQAIHDGQAWTAWKALELLPADKLWPPENLSNFNYPETAFAIGIPGLLLVLVAIARRDALTWFFAGVAVLAFGFATAKSPFLELSAVVPGARVGDLKRFLFLVAVSLCTLAALGADRLVARERPRGVAALAAAIAILCALPFVQHLVVAGDVEAFRQMYAERLAREVGGRSVTPEMAMDAMRLRSYEAGDNLAMLLWTFGRSFVVAAAATIVVWWAPARTRILALAALAAVELVAAGAGTIVPVPVERVQRLPATLEPVAYATAEAERASRPRPRLFRLEVSGRRPQDSRLFPPNLGAFHGLEDLSAYNPLPKQRMEELFLAMEPPRSPGAPSIALGGAGVVAMLDSATLHHPVLDVLGCRFVLAARAAGQAPDDPRVVDRTPPGTPEPFHLYERTTTLPRATFVDRAEVLPDPQDRLAVLSDASRNFSTDVVLEDPEAEPMLGDGVPDADVEVVRHRDEEVVVHVTNREPGYLRLADPWDPGWTVTVDGERRKLLLADHYVRAVRLVPGTHDVVFRYDGVAAWIWPWLGLFGLGIAAVLGIISARGRRSV